MIFQKNIFTPYLLRILALTGMALTLAACAPPNREIGFPALSPAGHVYAVIEIPAGTNHKLEFNKASGQIEVDQLNGRDRIIQFLPYPGNYGFVPSTLMDKARGGDGDALDILVLAAYVPSGTVMEVRPIGILQLADGGEIDDKLIAVPVDSAQQIIRAQTLKELETLYPAAKQIIEDWFLHYKGPGIMTLRGWADEKVARADIEKWALKQKNP